MNQLKDEFLQLRYDDEKFAEQYDNTAEDFQAWIYEHCIGSEALG